MKSTISNKTSELDVSSVTPYSCIVPVYFIISNQSFSIDPSVYGYPRLSKTRQNHS